MSLFSFLRLGKGSSRSAGQRDRRRARLQVERLEERRVLSTAYLLTTTPSNSIGALVRFNTDNPAGANLGGGVAITGTGGEKILGIDFRPANGVLYGMSEGSRLFAINPKTGVATQVGAPGAIGLDPFTGVFQGIGFDFNPTADRLRVTEDDGTVNGQDDNFSVNPNTGIFTQQGDLGGAGTDVDVSAVAYTNNYRGATQTTLYAIETNQPVMGNSRLVMVTSPATGALTTIDSDGDGLGVVVNSQQTGFDIIDDRETGLNRAFAALSVGGVSGLYRIDLRTQDGGTGTGDALLVGNFTEPAGSAIRGLALVSPGATLAVGEGQGGNSTVRSFDAASQQQDDAYSALPGFQGGAAVALGHFNADGVVDLVVGAGPGGGPHVKVIDGATEVELASFFAFQPGFLGGVYVAVGDVNGDRVPDVIAAAGPGGLGPRVIVVNGTDLNDVAPNGQINDAALITSFFAYPATFTGGVTVAAGDVNADGRADIIAGTASKSSRVKVVNSAVFADAVSDVNADGVIKNSALLANQIIFAGFNGGVFVAAGDVNFDGRAEVVIGAGKGSPGGRVVVRSVQDNLTTNLATFLAFNSSNTAGARVAVVDVNGDGLFEIAVGSGAGVPEQIRVFQATGGFLFNFPTVFGGNRGVLLAGSW